MMFEHSDVIASWAQDPAPSPAPDLLADFDAFDFDPVDSEQYIKIFSGERRHYATPLAFWLAVIRPRLNERFRKRYFSLGYTKHLDSESRLRELHYFVDELVKPLPETARLLEVPVRSLKLGIDYCDAAILSEYPDKYVVVHWYSSA